MKQRIKKLLTKSSTYQSLNTIEIYADNIVNNISVLQSLQPHHTIIPVLKSNAYGHGIQEICTIIEKYIPKDQCPLIAVDSYPEYQIVHRHTSRDILILGEQLPSNYHLYDTCRTHLAVGSLTNLQALIQHGTKHNIHLFLNTGMNREGFQESEITQLTDILSTSQITITGVMSHFANADCIDSSYNQTQIHRFKTMYDTIQKNLSSTQHNFQPTYIHINNSAGISKNHDPFFNTSRAGLAFYGYYPVEKQDPYHSSYDTLTPALRLISTITTIQHLQAGESISYGHKWTAPQESRVATIPFGYHEGIPRSLNGTNQLIKHHEIYTPIIGTICMNISLLLGSPGMKLFDIIELISPDPSAPNSIAAISQKGQKIPYEILVGIDTKIKRTIM